MAPSSASKNQSTKDSTKTSAAYSDKNSEQSLPSPDNASKYQPTDEAVMDLQSLGPQDGLIKLFLDSVKDIYWAENELVKALPKMLKSASTKKLQEAIANHLKQT